MRYRDYPGTDRRGMGSRGATTKIGSRHLGGDHGYDPDHARLCRCGETPRFEWRAFPRCRGVGRIVCSCGRVGGWHRTRREATLAWNDLKGERPCGEARKVKP